MMQLLLNEIAAQVTPGAHALVIMDRADWHLSGKLFVPANITILPSPAPRLRSSIRSDLAVPAGNLALKQDLQFLRPNSGPVLPSLEQDYRSTLDHDVDREAK
ncbi:hypothetical protein [Roseibium album]|uniref:hypothetical protein n=1 Tax=Roseibium album TaxID=311410 RepID=UPI0032EE77C7